MRAWTGTESASAVFTCGNDGSHTKTLTAAVTSQVTTEPGCESTGVRTYTATVTFEGQTYTDTKTETLPAAGHVWGQPVWQWTGFAAQAVFACARDAGHTRTLTAAVTSQVTTEPGCESTGVRTYTATVTLEGRTYTDTKTETLPATGHDTQLVGTKDATCTEDGYTGDEVCKTCGETVTKGEVVKATGHHYKDGKCTDCGEKDPNYQPAQPGVKTGDASSVTLWVMLLTVSALLAAAVVVLPRRKHD